MLQSINATKIFGTGVGTLVHPKSETQLKASDCRHPCYFGEHMK
jgi:hypothetical protein